MAIKDILQHYANETNRVLNEIMAKEDFLAPTLLKSMEYTLFSGGKRLRPILTVMTAKLVDGDLKNAYIIGAALEMIHTYSLIHDDLPSMDNDDFRRGKPTNHKVYGAGIAILAGDGLLTLAFNILSKLELPAEKKSKIIELVSEGAGVNGMVGGQVFDLEAENREVTLQELKMIHKAKTGALFESAILAGAYTGNPSIEELSNLRVFAEQLGLSFQIVDDILDVIGDEEKLGKPIGSDQSLNKSTYPKLLGLDGAHKEALRVAEEAKASLDIFGEKSCNFKELMDFIVERKS